MHEAHQEMFEKHSDLIDRAEMTRYIDGKRIETYTLAIALEYIEDPSKKASDDDRLCQEERKVMFSEFIAALRKAQGGRMAILERNEKLIVRAGLNQLLKNGSYDAYTMSIALEYIEDPDKDTAQDERFAPECHWAYFPYDGMTHEKRIDAFFKMVVELRIAKRKLMTEGSK